MKILFLHGWGSVTGGVKPSYLARHGHEVLNPALPDDDFEASVRIAQELIDREQPSVIVGSSRGGAVAMNVKPRQSQRLVLLCPAWKRWGTAKTVPPETIILHSRADEVIPFADSEELVSASGLDPTALVEVGDDHRLADPAPLAAMLDVCNRTEPIAQSGLAGNVTTGLSNTLSTSLRRVFTQAFTATDIAEPLVSFDEEAASIRVRELLEQREFCAVGVRRSGHVAGFALRADLGDRPLGAYIRPCPTEARIGGATPLVEVVLKLVKQPRLFVESLGTFQGIVTPSDLQKAPFRMWLFGFVTLIEMRFTEMIRGEFASEEWRTLISPTRLTKALTLLDERRRRQQDLSLLDCLQFSDKGQIVAKHEPIRSRTIFTSRRQAEEMVKRLEQLRNNLAHSQDILACDWETIVRLSERLAAG